MTSHDDFLGATGSAPDEFDRLTVTVTCEADLLAFLEALLADDDLTNWEGPIEVYLDAVLDWLRSAQGRERMAAFPSAFSAMAAALYSGIDRRR